MALEKTSLQVDKLKKKLQKRYPNHNFDIPSMPSTECKMKGKCPATKPTFYDNDGNYYCGVYVDYVSDIRSMKKEKRECGAYLVDLSIRKAEQHRKNNVQPLS